MPNDSNASSTTESAKIIVLSGPPGSGKTTVGSALADTAASPTVHLVTDAFYVAIKKGFVPPYLPEAARQNEVVIDVIVACMLGYARGGYDVIVDGIIGPWSLTPFIKAATRDAIPLSFVVLRPSLKETLRRAMGRADKELKDSGPINGLYEAFERLGPLERHVIDSTSESVDATTEQVRAGIRTWRLLAPVP